MSALWPAHSAVYIALTHTRFRSTRIYPWVILNSAEAWDGLRAELHSSHLSSLLQKKKSIAIWVSSKWSLIFVERWNKTDKVPVCWPIWMLARALVGYNGLEVYVFASLEIKQPSPPPRLLYNVYLKEKTETCFEIKCMLNDHCKYFFLLIKKVQRLGFKQA